MPSPDAYEWFTRAGREVAPGWRNTMTFESLARAAEYVPAAFIDLIAPRPLLIQAARRDSLIPFAQIERVCTRGRAEAHRCFRRGPLRSLYGRTAPFARSAGCGGVVSTALVNCVARMRRNAGRIRPATEAKLVFDRRSLLGGFQPSQQEAQHCRGNPKHQV